MESNQNEKRIEGSMSSDRKELLEFFQKATDEELYKYLRKIKKLPSIDLRTCNEIERFTVITRGIRELFKLISSLIKIGEEALLLVIAPRGTGRTVALRYINCLFNELKIRGELIETFYSITDFEHYTKDYLFIINEQTVKPDLLRDLPGVKVARYHPYKMFLDLQHSDLERPYQYILFPEPSDNELRKIIQSHMKEYFTKKKLILKNPLLNLLAYKYSNEFLGLNDFSKINNLSEIQFRILFSICEKPKSLKELATEFGLKKPTIHHHISKLEEQNLVVKVRDKRGVKYKVSKLAYQIYTEKKAIEKFLLNEVVRL